MSLLSRFFGRKDTPPAETGAADAPVAGAEVYEGFTLTPTPIKEGQVYRVSARIERDVDGVRKAHTLIRADTMADPQEAATISLAKARQMVDQMGLRVFDT